MATMARIQPPAETVQAPSSRMLPQLAKASFCHPIAHVFNPFDRFVFHVFLSAAATAGGNSLHPQNFSHISLAVVLEGSPDAAFAPT